MHKVNVQPELGWACQSPTVHLTPQDATPGTPNKACVGRSRAYTRASPDVLEVHNSPSPGLDLKSMTVVQDTLKHTEAGPAVGVEKVRGRCVLDCRLKTTRLVGFLMVFDRKDSL